MNPDQIKPASPAPAPARLVIPSTTKRDTLMALLVGAAVLIAVGAGVFSLSKVPGTPSTNQLTGMIVAKHDTGEKEISFSKKGLSTDELDDEFSFDVRTDPDGRIYEVPVPKEQYGMYEVGAKYRFIRPPSEQH